MDSEVTKISGRVLDRIITEKLGYSVFPVEANTGRRKDHPSYPPERLETTETHYMISVPDTSNSRIWGFAHPTEQDAWNIILDSHPFSSELDTAITLLASVRQWRIEYDTNYGIDHRTGYSLSINGIYCVQFEPTPALAVCNGWLAWKDAIAANTEVE